MFNIVKKRVSLATLRNWKRLHIIDVSTKLRGRANKLLSKKNVVPIECFSHKENIAVVNNIVGFINREHIAVKTAVNSLCLNLLLFHGVDKNTEIADYIEELRADYDERCLELALPTDELDIVGIVYQSLLIEGEKNESGVYYTPQKIIADLMGGVALDGGRKILDPCCGSGRFLLNINADNPADIYGFDIDDIAVNIAKTNLLIKYKGYNFCPKVYRADFLKLDSDFDFAGVKFDYIISNPPWGTKYKGEYSSFYPEIGTREIFSYFIVKSHSLLRDNGVIRFVLPEAVLNVQCHKDIRSFISAKLNIEKISLYGSCFTSVVSNVISVSLKKSERKTPTSIKINDCGKRYNLAYKDLNLLNDSDKTFSLMDKSQAALLRKIYGRPYSTLVGVWGLGIVTGDNEGKLSSRKSDGDMSPILTGADVEKFNCKAARKYFIYERNNLQQVARDEIYTAPEKLIYKFISKRLVFAYDDKKRFVLNSANILIPKINGMSIKTVCAFLNSDLMQFVYHKIFKTIKVLKSNLCKLPFPIIDSDFDRKLTLSVDKYLSGDCNLDEINDGIFDFYRLSTEEIGLIRSSIG